MKTLLCLGRVVNTGTVGKIITKLRAQWLISLFLVLHDWFSGPDEEKNNSVHSVFAKFWVRQEVASRNSRPLFKFSTRCEKGVDKSGLSLSSSSSLFKHIPKTDNADSKNQQQKVPSYRPHQKFFCFQSPDRPVFPRKYKFYFALHTTFFPLTYLFLPVAVLGMCSQTTDSYMYICPRLSIASYHEWHLYMIKVWSEMGACATLLFNVWWVLSSWPWPKF